MSNFFGYFDRETDRQQKYIAPVMQFFENEDRVTKLTWEQSTIPAANGGKQIRNASKGL